MSRPNDNQALFAFGRRCARGIDRRISAVCDKLVAIREVAKEEGEGVAEVRTAYEFACHVDALSNVVPGARKMILAGGNPHLTPRIVADLIRKSADAEKQSRRSPRSHVGADERPKQVLRTAMKRAAAGLHPFAPLPPAGLDAEAALWHYDIFRVQEAAKLLARAEAVVNRPDRRLLPDEVADLAVHAVSVRVATDAMRPVVLRGGINLGGVAPSPGSPESDREEVVRLAKRARGLVEAVTGDVLRAAHTRDSTAVRADLAQAVCDVAGSAARILQTLPAPTAAMEPNVLKAPGGPLDIGGTYVIVYRADAPGVVRLGRLGTFWLPAGYLLYVGSAFQRGGVAFRTDRHLRATGSRMWNADHLRGFARAVERWWTHHDQKVECPWAMALAATPACSCPASGAGANDCKRCPAHLYYSRTRLSCADFARRLGATGSGGYTILWQAVSASPAAGTSPLGGRPAESLLKLW